jgi:hypothetical protein
MRSSCSRGEGRKDAAAAAHTPGREEGQKGQAHEHGQEREKEHHALKAERGEEQAGGGCRGVRGEEGCVDKLAMLGSIYITS